MVKVIKPELNVGIQRIPLQYMEGNGPNLQPLAEGLGNLASSFMRVEAEQKQKADTMQRYKSLSSLGEFETQSKLRAQQEIDNAAPDDTGVAQRVIDSQLKYEQEFIKTLPPELQPEFAMRAESIRGGITLTAHDSQDKLNTAYYKNDIKENQNKAIIDIEKDPAALERWKAETDARIDASGLTEAEKYFAKQENARLLETAGYGATVKQHKLKNVQFTNDLSTAAQQAGRELGVSPLDLLTVISFETGGTFNPDVRGGKNNQHVGLIQFGPAEQQMYGIRPGMTVGEQMTAVVRYLKDRGFKPGMSIYDLYSTINAGSPGKYNASDAANGGTPGTVADKVNEQMAAHREKAAALLGGKFEIPDTIDNDPRFSNVLYEDRVALQNDATTAVNRELATMAAERKAQQDAQFNDLMNGINDGRYGQKEIETAREQGWLSDYDQISKAQKLVEEKAKDTEDLRLFMERVSRGDALDPQDPDNKRGMGLWFKQDKGEEKLQAMDEKYITDNLAPTFRATGMLPGDAVGVLGAMTRSADNRKMLYAYKALNSLEEMNPDGYAAQVPEAVRNKADVYDILRYTMPEPELFTRLRESADPQAVQAKKVLYDNAKQQLDSQDNTSVNFQSVLDHFGASQAEVGIRGQVMQNEWRALLLDNASHGMSLEDANNAAIKQLSRKWGNSNIDGVTTLMRNPPEKFNPAMTSEQMTRQLRGELGLMPDEQVQLVSDGRTEADIATLSDPDPKKHRPVSYIPMILRDGMWTPATGMSPTNPGEKVIKRIYFKPSELDAEEKKKQVQIDNLDAKIKELERGLPAVRTGKVNMPGPVADDIARLKQQKALLEQEAATVSKNASQQYMTPAQQQLQDAQKAFAPLNAEMQSWTDPIEQWPKVKEWEKLYDDIERLRAEVEQEVMKKRSAGGVQ